MPENANRRSYASAATCQLPEEIQIRLLDSLARERMRFPLGADPRIQTLLMNQVGKTRVPWIERGAPVAGPGPAVE